MANNFKYHIRKLYLLKKQNKTKPQKHIQEKYLPPYTPSIHFQLLPSCSRCTNQTRQVKVTLSCPALSGLHDHIHHKCACYVSLMCLFPYCNLMKLDQFFFSQYQLPLFYEIKSKGKKLFYFSVILFLYFSYGKFHILIYLYKFQYMLSQNFTQSKICYT